jgi:hypothetical protein
MGTPQNPRARNRKKRLRRQKEARLLRKKEAAATTAPAQSAS